MNDHIPDPTKMINDTPRTDAVYFKQGATMYDLANEMKLVERELNAANGEIERLTAKVAQLYEGAEEQKQRIKQLEDIIKRASSAFFCDGSDKETAVAMLTILEESR
jgi:predicted  nucleic acid-binding Zn-ribbon protein